MAPALAWLLPVLASASPDRPTSPRPPTLRVCHGPSCTALGSRAVAVALRALLRHPADDAPYDIACGCLGECGEGPNVLVSGGDLVRPRKVRGVRDARALGELVRGHADGAGGGPAWRALEAFEEKGVGDAAAAAGRVGDAEDAYAAALRELEALVAEASPGAGMLCQAILLNRARMRIDTGDAHGALRDANRAVDLFAGKPKAWEWKAEAHLLLGEVEMAEQAFAVADRLAPDKARVAKHKNMVDRARPKKSLWSFFAKQDA